MGTKTCALCEGTRSGFWVESDQGGVVCEACVDEAAELLAERRAKLAAIRDVLDDAVESSFATGSLTEARVYELGYRTVRGKPAPGPEVYICAGSVPEAQACYVALYGGEESRVNVLSAVPFEMLFRLVRRDGRSLASVFDEDRRTRVIATVADTAFRSAAPPSSTPVPQPKPGRLS